METQKRILEPGERSSAGLPPEVWSHELDQAVRAQMFWLWQGYLAPGSVTLLTSQWKSGKTTLLSVLLAKRKTDTLLAGLPLRAGRSYVVSEEPPAHWQRRHAKLDFGRQTCFLCRPFRGKPRHEEWLALLDRVAERARDGIDLVVIDALASFLPGGENSADCMLRALLPLQRLTSQGMSVLVLHHPSKGEPQAGQAARGSGALAGYVDILVEMRFDAHRPEVRRRRLQAFSRYEDTPARLVIELTADGTDYLAHGDFVEEEYSRNWDRLRTVLAAAPNKLTREEVRTAWPDLDEVPAEISVWRWLERAVAEGKVCRDGKGRKGRPYRYWLPEQMEVWRRQPFFLEDLPELEGLD